MFTRVIYPAEDTIGQLPIQNWDKSKQRQPTTYVHLSDRADLAEIISWINHNCIQEVIYEIVDVSDVSYTADEIVQFGFFSLEDATMFSLRWR